MVLVFTALAKESDQKTENIRKAVKRPAALTGTVCTRSLLKRNVKA
jgi:hypothetical protein